MGTSIYKEARNILEQYEIDNKSTLEQIITAFTAIKNIYAEAKRSADVYSELKAALVKSEENLKIYEHSASANSFEDLFYDIYDIYEEGNANG